VEEVFEVVIAPLVAGLLFGTEPQGPEAVGHLLDRLNRLARVDEGSGSSQE
jgi:hypothetical protein